MEIIEHVLTSIELFLEVPCCRSVSLRFFHRCRSRLEWMTSISEKILELLDGQAGVAISVDRIVSWHHNSCRGFRHENMFALPINPESGFLQRFDRAQMIYAGKFRH